MANDYRDRDRGRDFDRNRDLDESRDFDRNRDFGQNRDFDRFRSEGSNRGMFGYEGEGYLQGGERGLDRDSDSGHRGGRMSGDRNLASYGRDDFGRDRSASGRDFGDVARDRSQAFRNRNDMPDRFDAGRHGAYDDSTGGFGGGSYGGNYGGSQDMNRGRMANGGYFGDNSFGSTGTLDRNVRSSYAANDFGNTTRNIDRQDFGRSETWRDMSRDDSWRETNRLREFRDGNRGEFGDNWQADRSYGFDRGVDRGSSQPVRESFRGRGPKGYQRSDERIREDVCERLELDDRVDASEIDVTVNSGVVTLSGVVHDRQMKRRAEDVAEAATGVHDVNNQIRIDRHTGRHGDDTLQSGILGLTNTNNVEEGGAAGHGGSNTAGTTGQVGGVASMAGATGNAGMTTAPMTNPGAVATGANTNQTRSSNTGITSGNTTAADRSNRKK